MSGHGLAAVNPGLRLGIIADPWVFADNSFADKYFALADGAGYPPGGGIALARLLYSAVFYLLSPFICIRLWWRGRLVPGYRLRWAERFGFVTPVPAERKVIWVHAVSVGETVAAAPLVKQLQERYPNHLVAVTNTTPTGSERVRAMLGDSVYHCYAPYDLPCAVARVVTKLHPEMLIIMETELWPNLIHHCRRRHIPVVVANARLSAKSARGYQRFSWLSAPMLRDLALVAAQYPEDGQRFVQLGLPADRLRVTGNIKFDFTISPQQRQLAEWLVGEWRGVNGRPVWLVASTHRGEEEIILDAFRQIQRTVPELLLVLVPRHPDRFGEVAELCGKLGFAVVKRSENRAPEPDVSILLGDTMGELAVFYGACDLAFVGGSLVAVGGHNLLEPAAWGVPVLSGSQLFNFAEISNLLLAANALTICNSAADIAGAALAVVEANRGAMAKLLAVIGQVAG
jgi:3-deoxy-D-manno-octulosonic-acid transferase